MTAVHSGAARNGSRWKSTLGFLNVAATEIKALIRKSSEEVVDLVNATGDSLEEIATHVAGITERIGVIADVAKAQATSLHEVNSSAPQMDQSTRKNAAMVEENTAVTHCLAADAPWFRTWCASSG